MNQEDFFGPRVATQDLWPHQAEAVAAVKAKLAEYNSTLVVMATGTGKTRVASQLIMEWPWSDGGQARRCLFLAHRDELLGQARKRLEAEAGERVGLEQADYYADGERIVVASIQTMMRDRRLERWPADTFGLVVADECHHAPSPSWRKVLGHFGGAKLLGLTATPDRADERALGMVFTGGEDSVAYVYEISDAIQRGSLAPIMIKPVYIEDIDFSKCRKMAGDLETDDVEAVILQEKALHGIASATVKEAGDRRTLMFTPGVASAHQLADIMCRYRAGFARAIDGKMDLDTRRRIIAAHKRGEFVCLVNCNIATEGYDDPDIEVIAMARPTMSRALCEQMVGRGLRRTRTKEHCLIVEFTGNTGRHELATVTDVLGGKYGEEIVRAAKRRVATGQCQSPMEALAEAAEKARLAALEARRRVTADVRYRTTTINPFAVLRASPPDETWARRFGGKPASEAQIEGLRKWGITDIPEGLMSASASKLMATCVVRKNKGLATYRQMRTLSKYGISAVNWSFIHASRALDALARNGWKVPVGGLKVEPRERQPGEEG